MTRKDTSWYDKYGPKWFDAVFHRHTPKLHEYKKEAAKLCGGLTLDAGCAVGILSPLIEDGVFVDFSSDALGSRWLGGDRPRVVASVEDLPFREGIFDSIVAVETIEHLNEPKRFMRDARRILRQEGVFVSTFPTYSRPASNHKWKHISPHLREEWFDKLFDWEEVRVQRRRVMIICRQLSLTE